MKKSRNFSKISKTVSVFWRKSRQNLKFQSKNWNFDPPPKSKFSSFIAFFIINFFRFLAKKLKFFFNFFEISNYKRILAKKSAEFQILLKKQKKIPWNSIWNTTFGLNFKSARSVFWQKSHENWKFPSKYPN